MRWARLVEVQQVRKRVPQPGSIHHWLRLPSGFTPVVPLIDRGEILEQVLVSFLHRRFPIAGKAGLMLKKAAPAWKSSPERS